MSGGDLKLDNIFLIIIAAFAMYYLLKSTLCNNQSTNEGFGDPKEGDKCGKIPIAQCKYFNIPKKGLVCRTRNNTGNCY